LVSAIIQKPVNCLYDQAAVNDFLLNGGAIVFQDDQTVPQVKALQCSDWMRLKRRTKFPFKKLINEGVKWGDTEIMRRYQICFQST
jgi:hypothetical protein